MFLVCQMVHVIYLNYHCHSCVLLILLGYSKDWLKLVKSLIQGIKRELKKNILNVFWEISDDVDTFNILLILWLTSWSFYIMNFDQVMHKILIKWFCSNFIFSMYKLYDHDCY